LGNPRKQRFTAIIAPSLTMARPSDPGKKAKIIKAAITIFSQTGYTGTRIAEVARAAGIGKGTIYEYFRSKEDLFFATFEYVIFESSTQYR
jgi:AcrR family transcriptional regulator